MVDVGVRPALSLATVLLLSCGTQNRGEDTGIARQAVTNSTSDGADPAVVALVETGTGPVCTGTLVSPHVVLTAAHCQIDATSFTQYQAYFGSSPGSGGTLVPLSAAVIHPAFDPSTLANDIALVVLAADVAVTPVPMLRDGTALAGATVRVVGFGLAGDAGAGAKRSGTAAVSSTTATTFGLTPAPSLPCVGDSGGPELLTVGGTEYVAGVTSHGDVGCAKDATATRVDAFVTSFIEPYLGSVGPDTAGAGARCLYPEQCSEGACVTASDDANIMYCAPTCSNGTTCPAKTTCTSAGDGSRCLYPLPTPGALGSSCSSATDCVGSECIPEGVCSIPCVSGDGDCPSGFECVNTSDISFYCIAQPAPPTTGSSGSCDTAAARRSTGGGSLAWIAGVVAVAAVGMRRRS
jgi:secreted trypsin-like serine protease